MHNDHQAYTKVAVALHWLIAAFILFNLTLGWFMEGFPPSLKGLILPLHISCGMSVLVLTVFRVLWRLIHQPPPFESGTSSTEGHAAHIVHFLLYLAMVLMPMSGWAIISSHPAPGSSGAAADEAARPAPPAGAKPAPKGGGGGMKAWGLVPIPSIAAIQAVGETPGGLPAQRQLHERFVSWHAIGSYLLIGLLLLHVVGALKHQLVDGQQELQRMSFRKRPIT